MNDSMAAEFLRGHKWKLYESADPGLLREGTFARYVPGVQHKDVDALVRFLERFVDVGNFGPGNHAFVVDPGFEGGVKAGRWRHVRCRLERTDEQDRPDVRGTRWRVVQELAEGFLDVLDFGEAKLVETQRQSGDASTAGGRWFTLEWKGVDPDRAEALCVARGAKGEVQDLAARKVLRADELTDVDVVKLEGDFYSMMCGFELDERDGSATVRWMVGEARFYLEGFSNWAGWRQAVVTYWWNVPEQVAQGLLDAYKDTGRSARVAGRDQVRGLVDLVLEGEADVETQFGPVGTAEDCDAVESAEFLFGGTDEDALGIPAVIPAGVSYRRNVTLLEDGRFAITLTMRVRKFRDIPEYGSEFRADQETDRKEWKGVTDQDLSAELSGQAGKVVRVTRNVQTDCSVDVDRDVVDPIELGVTHDSEARADRTAETVIARNASAKADATPVAGKVVQAQSRKNEFGLYDNQVTTVTPVNQTTTSGEDRADQTSEVVENTQADAAVSAPPSADAGEIVRVQNRETEFGKFSTRLETVTAKELGVTHDSEDSAGRSATRTVEQNAAAKADAPAAGPGQLSRAQSRQNEFGLYDNTVETVSVKALGVSHTSEEQADRSATRTVEQNAAAAADAPAAGPGQLSRAQSRQNEFGLYDNTVETVAAKAQAYSETFTRGGGNQPMTLYWGKNATALPTTANVQSASVRKNEFDRLDYNLVQVVPDSTITVRVPFKAYTVNKQLPDMVERQVINGQPYKRTYPNVFFKAAGSSNEGTVMNHLADCNYQVTFNPMANGKFFHGKGIKRGDPEPWEKDGELPS